MSWFFCSCSRCILLKLKNIGTVSLLEVISRSLQVHFVKYYKKEPLVQTLVCCYIMALLFLEMLSYCAIRKVSVSNKLFFPALFSLVENIFELTFIGLTLLFILKMDVNSHVKSDESRVQGAK